VLAPHAGDKFLDGGKAVHALPQRYLTNEDLDDGRPRRSSKSRSLSSIDLRQLAVV
jgi:hypothetical protein